MNFDFNDPGLKQHLTKVMVDHDKEDNYYDITFSITVVVKAKSEEKIDMRKARDLAASMLRVYEPDTYVVSVNQVEKKLSEVFQKLDN